MKVLLSLPLLLYKVNKIKQKRNIKYKIYAMYSHELKFKSNIFFSQTSEHHQFSIQSI